MMKRRKLLVIVLAVLAPCVVIAISVISHRVAVPRQRVPGLSFSQLSYYPESVVQYEGSQQIGLCDGEEVRVVIEVSTKGNGELRLVHSDGELLRVRIYDQHEEDDQRKIFENRMLSYEFIDQDLDGVLDLHVWGIEKRIDEFGSTEKKSIGDFYYFDRRVRKWKTARHSLDGVGDGATDAPRPLTLNERDDARRQNPAVAK